jgi:hypothetical protein
MKTVRNNFHWKLRRSLKTDSAVCSASASFKGLQACSPRPHKGAPVNANYAPVQVCSYAGISRQIDRGELLP